LNGTLSLSLRPKQAAAFLGISTPTLWRWVKQRKEEGFPQPLHLGPRTTIFDQAELVGFRDKQKRGAE
jgi:prophage regulatory protein